MPHSHELDPTMEPDSGPSRVVRTRALRNDPTEEATIPLLRERLYIQNYGAVPARATSKTRSSIGARAVAAARGVAATLRPAWSSKLTALAGSVGLVAGIALGRETVSPEPEHASAGLGSALATVSVASDENKLPQGRVSSLGALARSNERAPAKASSGQAARTAKLARASAATSPSRAGTRKVVRARGVAGKRAKGPAHGTASATKKTRPVGTPGGSLARRDALLKEAAQARKTELAMAYFASAARSKHSAKR